MDFATPQPLYWYTTSHAQMCPACHGHGYHSEKHFAETVEVEEGCHDCGRHVITARPRPGS